MSYYIEGFSSLRPRYEVDQIDLLHWIAKLHAVAAHTAKLPYNTSVPERLMQLGSGEGKIRTRGVQISDPLEGNCDKMLIYPVTRLPEGVGLKERMLVFEKEVYSVFEKFYGMDGLFPEHIVHVTCTGYVAPSPAQKIVSRRSAQHSFVTHAYHMGCYASIPAIQIATGSLSALSPNAFVDVVHTEMSSLHFHPLRHSTEQLVVQSLFADGFIKYSIHKDRKQCSLQILSLLQEIIPDTLESMSWRCEDTCLSMTLSKKVSFSIAGALEGYFSRLIQRACVDPQQIKAHALFAIHPGGPKIIQEIRALFSLEEAQIAHSLYVFQNCGNMSSATLPHIWESIVQDDTVKTGTFIVSLGFGPGLSIAGALFQKVGKE